jgi:hypothetical protein
VQQGVDVTNSKIREHIKKMFSRMDGDGSGTVTLMEYMTFAGCGDLYKRKNPNWAEEAKAAEKAQAAKSVGDKAAPPLPWVQLRLRCAFTGAVGAPPPSNHSPPILIIRGINVVQASRPLSAASKGGPKEVKAAAAAAEAGRAAEVTAAGEAGEAASAKVEGIEGGEAPVATDGEEVGDAIKAEKKHKHRKHKHHHHHHKGTEAGEGQEEEEFEIWRGKGLYAGAGPEGDATDGQWVCTTRRTDPKTAEHVLDRMDISGQGVNQKRKKKNRKKNLLPAAQEEMLPATLVNYTGNYGSPASGTVVTSTKEGNVWRWEVTGLLAMACYGSSSGRRKSQHRQKRPLPLIIECVDTTTGRSYGRFRTTIDALLAAAADDLKKHTPGAASFPMTRGVASEATIMVSECQLCGPPPGDQCALTPSPLAASRKSAAVIEAEKATEVTSSDGKEVFPWWRQRLLRVREPITVAYHTYYAAHLHHWFQQAPGAIAAAAAKIELQLQAANLLGSVEDEGGADEDDDDGDGKFCLLCLCTNYRE